MPSQEQDPDQALMLFHTNQLLDPNHHGYQDNNLQFHHVHVHGWGLILLLFLSICMKNDH